MGGSEEYLTEDGCFNFDLGAKCVIFPKGETTWDGFHKPFEDGDILISGLEGKDNKPFMFKQINRYNNAECHCAINCYGDLIFNSDNWTPIKGCRIATPEEKQRLFDAIKENGYKWNEETKTLEKLINKNKFVIGATVTNGKIKGKISLKDGDSYVLEDGTYIFFNEVHNWELVPDKFDITTLKPFESKVLMRSSNAREWTATFYSHYSNNKFYGCGMCCDQCIPYEGNEHLLGTTNDCDEFYKTWE